MPSPLLATVFLLSLSVVTSALFYPYFRDVSKFAGVADSRTLKKYGGPCVVDLDRDGYPDLILGNHDSAPVQLYFNNRDGTFTLSKWRHYHDIHGLNAFPVSPWTPNMRFTLSVGGNFGRTPNHPLMYEVNSKTRQITSVSAQSNITIRGGRGRTAVFLQLSQRAHKYWPDALFINAQSSSGGHQFSYENIGNGKYALRSLKGRFSASTNQLATVTDVDNDGAMEVVTFWSLKLWKINGYFSMKEVTSQVLPSGLEFSGVTAVAEIDYNNDGYFDLYVSRTKVGWWMPPGYYHDYLLENRGGYYVDVSEKVGIPRHTKSQGVTAGDFNNDGFTDLHITMLKGRDFVLLNVGGKSFRRWNAPIRRPGKTHGDMSVAFDYDMDGRLDILSSQGSHNFKGNGGSYHLFRNEMALNQRRHWLHVRVGDPWDRSSTPLHAVVYVRAGHLKMRRRVGSPGSAFSNSYLETLHFGLAGYGRANYVSVIYSSGAKIVSRNVRAGQTLKMGWVR